MAIGAPVNLGMDGRSTADVNGSVQSSWGVIVDDATTAQQAGDFIDLQAINDATFHWAKVPFKATRVQLRARMPETASVFTTAPAGELWGIDSQGVPQRLDQLDQSSATKITLNVDSAVIRGVTIDGVGAVASDDGFVYGDVSTPTGDVGYDVTGCTWVGFPVRTAAAVTDGAAAVAVAVLARFLN